MFDWKIIAALLVVFVFLALFVGSMPAVSRFLGDVGDRVSSVFSGLGVEQEGDGIHVFSLAMNEFDRIDFMAKNSDVKSNEEAEANLGRGVLNVKNFSISGFSGSGHVDSAVFLNGTAESLVSQHSNLGKGQLSISGSTNSFYITNISINTLSDDDATGELILDSAIIKFSGHMKIKGVTGSISLDNGTIHIEGTARSISVPSIPLK